MSSKSTQQDNTLFYSGKFYRCCKESKCINFIVFLYYNSGLKKLF